MEANQGNQDRGTDLVQEPTRKDLNFSNRQMHPVNIRGRPMSKKSKILRNRNPFVQEGHRKSVRLSNKRRRARARKETSIMANTCTKEQFYTPRRVFNQAMILSNAPFQELGKILDDKGWNKGCQKETDVQTDDLEQYVRELSSSLKKQLRYVMDCDLFSAKHEGEDKRWKVDYVVAHRDILTPKGLRTMVMVKWWGGNASWVSLGSLRLHNPYSVVQYALKRGLL